MPVTSCVMRDATSVTVEPSSALAASPGQRSTRARYELFVIRTDSVNQHGRLAVRGRFTAFVRG